MREVGAFEAKNKLGTLLDWVEKGEEVLITRHGKAVARCPADSLYRCSRPRQSGSRCQAHPGPGRRTQTGGLRLARMESLSR